MYMTRIANLYGDIGNRRLAVLRSVPFLDQIGFPVEFLANNRNSHVLRFQMAK